MKKLLTILLSAAIIILSAVPVLADEEKDVYTDWEIISSFYDEADDGYNMIVSRGQYVHVSADNTYKWYYTSCPDFYKISEFSSDGSEIGDKMLAAVKNHEPIPAGTIVEPLPLEDGSYSIIETYPPRLAASGLKFVGEGDGSAVISEDATVSEIEAINDFCPFEGRYPYPDGSFADALLAADGAVYRLVRENGRPVSADVGDNAVIRKTTAYKDMPQADGEQNISLDGALEYVSLGGGKIAVRTSDYYGWSLFEEAEASAMSSGDWPAMINYKGVIYKLSYSPLELPQGAEFVPLGELTYSEGEPDEPGTQNYSRTPVEFSEAVYNGVDCVAAYCNGDYMLFLPEDYKPQNVDLSSLPEEKNPGTGRRPNAAAAVLIAGLAIWAGSVIAEERRGER